MTPRRLISLVSLGVLFLGSCSIEPPLYLRRPVATRLVLSTHVNVDIMWQLDWQAKWQFNWNASALGPVGYPQPAGMRLHIYTQNAEGTPAMHTVHNFVGTSATMDVFVGKHNLLFHNNDSETLLFTADDELSPVHSYTRIISSGLKTSNPVQTTAQKMSGVPTKADEIEEEPVALMPDALYALYDENRLITDNPDDYVYEDGRYVLKITGDLTPATYIYLIQVKLLNNGGRVVGSGGGAALTGMSAGVNLWTRETHVQTVSVPMDMYMDRAQDMLGARVLSFGLPGCNPYDEESVAAAPRKEHFLVMNVSYSNGSWRNVRVDITDEVRALPLGGVITLEIDVDDIPPDSSPGGVPGGGFQALVSDWEEQIGITTISD